MYMPQLTETVRTVRKDHPGAFRYKWEFSDGPARFEAVFIDRVTVSYTHLTLPTILAV